jgi:hypothetical protein
MAGQILSGKDLACHLGPKGAGLTDRDGRHKGGHDRDGVIARIVFAR